MDSELMENELGRALRHHRANHPDCDQHCQEYLDIAREYTEPRQIQEGPVAPHKWLSIREL